VQIAGGVLFQQIIGGRENNIYSINCGLTNTGAAYCWGANTRGQLGTQATLASCTQGNLIFGCTGSPVPVAGSLSFAALAIGNEHVCGLTTNQRVYCWGRNDAGQLGTGTTQDVATPVQAATTIRFP
jgi:alpha-tubulin suppressor-like RCC1 family protein